MREENKLKKKIIILQWKRFKIHHSKITTFKSSGFPFNLSRTLANVLIVDKMKIKQIRTMKQFLSGRQNKVQGERF